MTQQEPLQTALTLAQDLQGLTEGTANQKVAELIQLLTQALTPVEEDDFTLGKFVSVMVHEIRKPMTSIRGYADMMDKRLVGELNEMQGQFMATIRRNVISMEKLVTDLSDYSKMRTGRTKAESKMDMAKNILLAVEKETKELAAEHKHEVAFEIPDGLPLLNLDGNRARQALIKLLENAIKYTPEGGHIIVRARPVEGGLEITIKDNGVGMTPEEVGRLGELWFRGDDELVTSTKGYGLGIPIALECLRLAGGRLFYESEKGVGSTFGIFLPGMS